jgi:hypothetical protein
LHLVSELFSSCFTFGRLQRPWKHFLTHQTFLKMPPLTHYMTNDMNEHMIWHDSTWFNMIWHDLTWFDINDIIWHEWHDLTQMTWFEPNYTNYINLWSVMNYMNCSAQMTLTKMTLNDGRRHGRGTYLFCSLYHPNHIYHPNIKRKFWLMKQNFFMIHFLGVSLRGRIVVHALKWRNLNFKKIVSAP